VSQAVQISSRGALGSTSYTWVECNSDGSAIAEKDKSGIVCNPGQIGAYAAFQYTFSFLIPGQNVSFFLGTWKRTGYFLVTGTDAGGANGSPAKHVLQVTLGITSDSVIP
jgi:archaellum component FlaF (FlaF/FlaG flagellin family)